jgi:hypothetical protein
MVARVSVIIRDIDSNVLEQGEAVQSETDGCWDYTTSTTMPMTPYPVVEAVAEDLPGNTHSLIRD